MTGKRKQKQLPEEKDIKIRHFNQGLDILSKHPIFSSLLSCAEIFSEKYGFNGYAKVYRNGTIHCSTSRYAEPNEWVHLIAHCLLHLGMGHFDLARFNLKHLNPDDTQIDQRNSLLIWNYACDLVVERFLADIKLGLRPAHSQRSEYVTVLPSGINDEIRIFERLMHDGVEGYTGFGTMNVNSPDMIFADTKRFWGVSNKPKWTEIFAAGLARAVRNAVNVAGGLDPEPIEKENNVQTLAIRTKNWFISKYPLLGAVAAAFKIIEKPDICNRMDIRIAAVSAYLQEIYINPAAGLTEMEYRFVIAHELLHAALRHDVRHQWRDAYFWNVACDYVVNLWLTEMGVGDRPNGSLYDEQLKGLSAESVYDIIVTDLRRLRKLATLRGVGVGDILSQDEKQWGNEDGINLDNFYRRCLAEGLYYHQEENRGYLPLGLVEDIRALSHPPVPWDVELARWFDKYFTPLEKKRSYARPSRRQSSTPDIPRPSWVISKSALEGRTFGVVLDTSGSMERALLASALGAIASYSEVRDVPAVRVIFCDANAYDQGYMKPEDIAGNVKVKGRGGTILQPAIDLLDQVEDFPKTAPILIITDGFCESRLALYGREHAYLIPEGRNLPFPPKGKISDFVNKNTKKSYAIIFPIILLTL
ncbi:MAG: hypothetical protein LBC74_07385 [Planctomycetaceae bacterium]|jgi:predicted metal-dependent peptidase|nr:hypothetical protein [Planctomycetaceae bacterium]